MLKNRAIEKSTNENLSGCEWGRRIMLLLIRAVKRGAITTSGVAGDQMAGQRGLSQASCASLQPVVQGAIRTWHPRRWWFGWCWSAAHAETKPHWLANSAELGTTDGECPRPPPIICPLQLAWGRVPQATSRPLVKRTSSRVFVTLGASRRRHALGTTPLSMAMQQMHHTTRRAAQGFLDRVSGGEPDTHGNDRVSLVVCAASGCAGRVPACHGQLHGAARRCTAARDTFGCTTQDATAVAVAGCPMRRVLHRRLDSAPLSAARKAARGLAGEARFSDFLVVTGLDAEQHVTCLWTRGQPLQGPLLAVHQRRKRASGCSRRMTSTPAHEVHRPHFGCVAAGSGCASAGARTQREPQLPRLTSAARMERAITARSVAPKIGAMTC